MNPVRLRSVLMCALLLAFPVSAAAPQEEKEADPDAKFLDQLVANGVPAAYGEIVSALSDSAGEALKEALKERPGDIARFANQKVWRDRISNLNQAIGRAVAALDVGGKVYSEDYYEAGVSAALTLIGELAGSDGGKALLQSYGITGPVVAAALTAVTVWRESSKALSESTVARELESLYATIETMTRSRGRTLGEGDPFPVTPENVEKVWKRIVSDPSFRRLFQVYVENELQKEFPQPDFWDKVEVYVADPVIAAAAGGLAPAEGFAAAAADPNAPVRESSAAERLERIQQQKLMAQHAEMKQYVAGLVGFLNRAAKAEEQRVIARRALAEMKAKIEAGGMTLDQYFAKIQKALESAGVVEAYLKKCMPEIEKAAREDDYETLQAHLRLSRDYVRDVVAWLPPSGPTAGLRVQLYDGLKASYRAAAEGIRAIRKRLALKVEKPPVPPPAQGQPGPVQAVDPQHYYEQYFKPLIKPFDWGGNGDPARVLNELRAAVAAGEFNPPDNLYALPAGRTPRADVIVQAWQKQNWAVAFGGAKGSLPVPDGPREESIAEYERRLKADIAARAGKTPDDLVALRQSLEAQGKAIEERFKEGNAMVFPSLYGKKPPEGETAEQARARIAAGQAIMEEAKRAGDALKPERDREAAVTAAWAGAGRMAGEAAAAEVAAARLTHAEIAGALASEMSLAQMKARAVAANVTAILGRLKAISLPPAGSPSTEDLLPSLRQAREFIERDPYTKLGTLPKPPDSTAGAGLAEAAGRIVEELRSRARQIRAAAARAEAEALALAEAYETGEKEFDALLSEFAEELDEIRQLAAPDFLSQDEWRRRRDAAQPAARSLRAAVESLVGRADQEASNREADAFWLQRAAVNFLRLVSVGQSYGVLEEAGSYGAGGSLRIPMMDDRGIVSGVPYPHYVTQAEKNEALAEMRAVWTSTNLSKFAGTLAPWLKELVEGYFQQLAQAPGFPEENFFVSSKDGGRAALPVTKSGLARAQEMLAKMQPGTPAFEEGWRALPSILPLEVSYGGSSVATFRDVVVPAQSPLSGPYTAFRNQLKELYGKQLQLADQMREDERKKQADEARRDLPALIAAVRKRLQDAQKLVDTAMAAQPGDRAAIEQLYQRLEDFHTSVLTSEPYPRMVQLYGWLGDANDPLFRDAADAASQVGMMSGRLHEAKSRLKDLLNRPEDRSARLKEFYDRFRQAYESRSEARLMGLIADSWSAGDGTTVDDLRDHFRNMFSVFNEIRVTVSNIQAQKVGTDLWQVSYDITITGRIFENNIKHEEKSSVTEQVQLDSRGGKIVRTLQGRFWYIQ